MSDANQEFLAPVKQQNFHASNPNVPLQHQGQGSEGRPTGHPIPHNGSNGARHNFPVQNQYSQPPPPLMGVQDYPGSSLQNPNWNVAGKQNNGGRARERGGGGQQDPRVKSKRGR